MSIHTWFNIALINNPDNANQIWIVGLLKIDLSGGSQCQRPGGCQIKFFLTDHHHSSFFHRDGYLIIRLLDSSNRSLA
jgi:hypothetical protein